MKPRGIRWPRDREVEDGPLGRGAVEGVGRDGHLAHRVALDAGGRRCASSRSRPVRLRRHGADGSDSRVLLRAMSVETAFDLGHLPQGDGPLRDRGHGGHDARGRPAPGITVNALSSVSLEPPLVVVALDRRRYITPKVHAAGLFAVNVLGEHQQDLADCFAGAPVEPGRELFCGAAWQPGAHRLAVPRRRNRHARVLGRRRPSASATTTCSSAGWKRSRNAEHHPQPLLYYRRRYLRVERSESIADRRPAGSLTSWRWRWQTVRGRGPRGRLRRPRRRAAAGDAPRRDIDRTRGLRGPGAAPLARSSGCTCPMPAATARPARTRPAASHYGMLVDDTLAFVDALGLDTFHLSRLLDGRDDRAPVRGTLPGAAADTGRRRDHDPARAAGKRRPGG